MLKVEIAVSNEFNHFIIKSRQDFSKQNFQKTCPMGRAVSEDWQPASAALLHSVNPLPFTTRFARLNKSGLHFDTVHKTNKKKHLPRLMLKGDANAPTFDYFMRMRKGRPCLGLITRPSRVVILHLKI